MLEQMSRKLPNMNRKWTENGAKMAPKINEHAMRKKQQTKQEIISKVEKGTQGN